MPNFQDLSFCPKCGHGISNENVEEDMDEFIVYSPSNISKKSQIASFLTPKKQLLIGVIGIVVIAIIGINLYDSNLLNPVNRTLKTIENYVPNGGGCLSDSIYDNKISNYTSGWGRNQMLAFGLDVIDSNGNELTVGEFSGLAYRVLSARTQSGNLTKNEIDISYQPGFGLYNGLNGFFSDPNIAYWVKEGMKCSATS